MTSAKKNQGMMLTKNIERIRLLENNKKKGSVFAYSIFVYFNLLTTIITSAIPPS